MKTAVITGGAGFIGSHVAERFLAEGWDVHILDNLITGKRENLPLAAMLHKLDIREKLSADLVAGLRPDVLVHLAAQFSPPHAVTRRGVDGRHLRPHLPLSGYQLVCPLQVFRTEMGPVGHGASSRRACRLDGLRLRPS